MVVVLPGWVGGVTVEGERGECSACGGGELKERHGMVDWSAASRQMLNGEGYEGHSGWHRTDSTTLWEKRR